MSAVRDIDIGKKNEKGLEWIAALYKDMISVNLLIRQTWSQLYHVLFLIICQFEFGHVHDEGD